MCIEGLTTEEHEFDEGEDCPAATKQDLSKRGGGGGGGGRGGRIVGGIFGAVICIAIMFAVLVWFRRRDGKYDQFGSGASGHISSNPTYDTAGVSLVGGGDQHREQQRTKVEFGGGRDLNEMITI
jgi:hypothetical protein